MNLQIDPEFHKLLDPLTQEEYAGLEASILSEGCRDDLVVWAETQDKPTECNNCQTGEFAWHCEKGVEYWVCETCGYAYGLTLIDGHNRYEICQKYELPYHIKPMLFESRDDAILWIIDNQSARRNYSLYQKGVVALRKKEILARKAKENQALGHFNAPQYKDNPVYEIFPKLEIDVGKELAKEAGVSDRTLDKIEKIEAKAPEEVKQKIRAGDLTISKAYNYIKREEIREQARTIEPPAGKYRVVYADPPWQYSDKRDGNTTGAEDHYKTLSIAELCELPIKDMTEETLNEPPTIQRKEDTPN
jgi:transcriptional regulator with XRE-family HTH domain